MMYVIDASVHVGAVNPHDPSHTASQRLLQIVKERGLPVICPEIVIPEVAAAISRGVGDIQLARALTGSLRRLPNFAFVAVNAALADASANLAVQYKIRGCDSIYVAVAKQRGAPLITLDQEQRMRSSQAIRTFTPDEAVQYLETHHG